MEGLQPYIEMLRMELMGKFAEHDPMINVATKLRNQDFKNCSTIIKTALVGNAEYAAFLKASAGNKGFHLETEATISDTTIERILTLTWVVKQPIEKRILTTLNKLCFFTGYNGWEDFLQQKKTQLDSTNEDLSQTLIEAVRNADRAEFEAYKALPEIDTSVLEKYFTLTGSAFKRIYNILIRHKLRRWIISDPTNPSDYKTYSVTVKQITRDTAIVVTDEWWYLRWFDLNDFRTPVIYDTRNIQTFFLKKTEDNSWKVDSTEYPTYGALSYLKRRFRGRHGR